MIETSNIFALSTPPGKSGIAVIRISGSDILEVICNRFGIDRNRIVPRRTILTKLRDNDKIIDESLVIYFPSPNSFTGEDIIEFHIHGSIAVTKIILKILSEIPNFYMAEPGEFSRRAFLNGKMDLTKVEGLSDLIHSETEAQQSQAMRQFQGKHYEIIVNWRERIIKISAMIEAYIDFPDEDIPDEIKQNIINEALNLQTEISSHLNNKSGIRIRDGLIGIIIGAPNAGKSSLLNNLANREVALVSDIAGTTRDLIEVPLDISGYPLTLIDTAGIREKKKIADEIEDAGIKKALSKIAHVDFILCLYDIEHIFPVEIPELNKKKNIYHIVTKIDKIDSKKRFSYIPEFLSEENIDMISSKTNENIDNLLEKIADDIKNVSKNSESSVVTQIRHQNILSEIIVNLDNFINDFQNNLPAELCAERIRVAISSIAKMTGEVTLDDILDQLFAQFCIGK